MEQQDFKKLLRGEQQQLAPAIRRSDHVRSDQFNVRRFALGEGADSVVVEPNQKPIVRKPDGA